MGEATATVVQGLRRYIHKTYKYNITMDFLRLDKDKITMPMLRPWDFRNILDVIAGRKIRSNFIWSTFSKQMPVKTGDPDKR